MGRWLSGTWKRRLGRRGWNTQERGVFGMCECPEEVCQSRIQIRTREMSVLAFRRSATGEKDIPLS